MFSFQPKEEELVGFYLFNKIAGKDYHSRVIPECDLYVTKNPWEIWQEFQEDSNCKAFSRDNELYLFTNLKKKGHSHSRIDRRVGLGSGLAEDSARPVFSVTQEGKCLVGSKKRYRFDKRGSEHHGRWIITEYSLEDSLLQQISNPNNFNLCKIKKSEHIVRWATEKKKLFQLKVADAAKQKRNGDGNSKEVVDLLKGRLPELVITMDKFLAFWDDVSDFVTLD